MKDSQSRGRVALYGAELFWPYRLEELVGTGGLAEVWRAVDSQTGRIVALKRFTGPIKTKASEELRAEIELLAAHALRGHPNVVEVYGGGPEPEPHVVMEFMDGGDLGDQLRRHGPLTLERTLDVGRAVANALAAAADGGIVHGDIKLSNVLIGSNGDIKLADFNVARVVGYSGASISGTVLSFAYAAPEVWDGKSTDASDLYALGVLLYECLVGHPPFAGTYTEVFRAHIERPPDLDALPGATPPSLRALIDELLAKDPDKRPADARSVLGRLKAIGTESDAVARDVRAGARPATIGDWVVDSPHTTTPWAWRARNSRTDKWSTIELFFGDATVGEELRRAVALNEHLVPFGAERLLETNRLLLRPGESFGRPTPRGWIFWVARDEIPPAAAVELDELTLGRVVERLRALQAAAASIRLTLDLSPANVAVFSNGTVHVRRPGLPGIYAATASRNGLAALHALAAPDARPLVAGAASLNALALALGGVSPEAAPSFDAPTVHVPGGPPPLSPDPAPHRTMILPRRPPPAPATGRSADRRSRGAALAAFLGAIALVLVSLLVLVSFNGLSDPSSATPSILGAGATDAITSAPTPTVPGGSTATPLLTPGPTLVAIVPTAPPAVTPIPSTGPTPVPTIAPTDPSLPSNPPPKPTDPPQQTNLPPEQSWQVDISVTDNRADDGERVEIQATSNRNVGGSPWHLQVFNPDTGFVHWSCKVGSICGGGARRENITTSYQARVSAVDGGDVQGQSGRVSVTWEPATTTTTWDVSLQVSDTQAANGERVSIVATSNQPVASSPYYIQVFNPDTGFIHWSCKNGTSCGGAASRQNITTGYQARISNSAGGDVQAQSARQSVTWQ